MLDWMLPVVVLNTQVAIAITGTGLSLQTGQADRRRHPGERHQTIGQNQDISRSRPGMHGKPSIAPGEWLDRGWKTRSWRSVNSANGQAEIGYSTVSRRLAEGVRILLLRFGIMARIECKKPKCNGRCLRSLLGGRSRQSSRSTLCRSRGCFSQRGGRLSRAHGFASLSGRLTCVVFHAILSHALE